MPSVPRFPSLKFSQTVWQRSVVTLALALALAHGAAVGLSATAAPPSRAEALRSMLVEGSPSGVMLMAHRADWRNYPENSIPGILSCIEMGLEIVEIDLQRTKDGSFVLMHDDTIDRTTTGRGRVRELTLAQVRESRLRNGYGAETPFTVPTLREALLVARGRVLVMIDKGYQHFREVAPLLEETGTANQVLMNGPDSPADAAKARAGGMGSVVYVPKVDFRKPQVLELVRVCLGHPKPVVVEVIFSEWTPAVAAAFQQFRGHGVRIWVNLLRPDLGGGASDDLALADPDRIYGQLLERGASVLQTDRPRELRDYVSRHFASRRGQADRTGDRN